MPIKSLSRPVFMCDYRWCRAEYYQIFTYKVATPIDVSAVTSTVKPNSLSAVTYIKIDASMSFPIFPILIDDITTINELCLFPANLLQSTATEICSSSSVSSKAWSLKKSTAIEGETFPITCGVILTPNCSTLKSCILNRAPIQIYILMTVYARCHKVITNLSSEAILHPNPIPFGSTYSQADSPVLLFTV